MSNDQTYLQIAQCVSQLSKDPKTKVGAVLVTKDGGVTIGYNSFPRGVAESTDRWASPKKYDFVLTAEVNAILAAEGKSVQGATLYVTQAPCLAGSKVAVQAGVSRIVCPASSDETAARATGHDAASDTHALATKLLTEAGVDSARI